MLNRDAYSAVSDDNIINIATLLPKLHDYYDKHLSSAEIVEVEHFFNNYSGLWRRSFTRQYNKFKNAKNKQRQMFESSSWLDNEIKNLPDLSSITTLITTKLTDQAIQCNLHPLPPLNFQTNLQSASNIISPQIPNQPPNSSTPLNNIQTPMPSNRLNNFSLPLLQSIGNSGATFGSFVGSSSSGISLDSMTSGGSVGSSGSVGVNRSRNWGGKRSGSGPKPTPHSECTTNAKKKRTSNASLGVANLKENDPVFLIKGILKQPNIESKFKKTIEKALELGSVPGFSVERATAFFLVDMDMTKAEYQKIRDEFVDIGLPNMIPVYKDLTNFKKEIVNFDLDPTYKSSEVKGRPHENRLSRNMSISTRFLKKSFFMVTPLSRVLNFINLRIAPSFLNFF